MKLEKLKYSMMIAHEYKDKTCIRISSLNNSKDFYNKYGNMYSYFVFAKYLGKYELYESEKWGSKNIKSKEHFKLYFERYF